MTQADAEGGSTSTRRSGVALWRQVADAIRAGIDADHHPPGTMLPSEFELARLNGVNRHTVRAAIASLSAEGIVRTHHGQGTVVMRRTRFSYPLRLRTRLGDGLRDQVERVESRLLGATGEEASALVAQALGLRAGAAVLRLETLSLAEARPVSLATSWFEAKRFEGIEAAFAGTRSFTQALRSLGVDDYVRRETRVTAGPADPAEAALLDLPRGAVLLVAHGLNVDGEGRPIQFSRTRFAADRIELTIDHG